MIPFISEDFWKEAAAEAELRRIFDICHGCRLCFNLCPSFEGLFEIIDGVDGDLERLKYQEFGRVVDLCYQCKLCYVKCPYTPPHEFDLDFPRSMLQARAVRVKKEGLPRQDKLLSNPDLIGRIGSLTAPISNLANRDPLNRLLMRKVVGIHHRRTLPRYHRETFAKWFRKHEPRKAHKGGGPNGRVALFYTCFVNYNDPEVGKAAVRVLERNGLEVICPEQRCCGMPFLDVGDIPSALKNLEANVRSLAAAVREGCKVVVPGPTCSYMLKMEYPFLSRDDETRLVAGSAMDLCEFLMALHRDGKLDTGFAHPQGRIAYHTPCHMRAQNIGYKSRDLMRIIPDTTVAVIERCSGMDGTWGMRAQFHDLSLKVGKRLFDDVKEAAPDISASDCPLAAMQMEQATGARPLHPVQILDKAYGPSQ